MGHLRLTEDAEAEHQVPAQHHTRTQHTEGADPVRIGRGDAGDHVAHAAAGIQRQEEHHDRRHYHHRALHHVGVDAGDHAAGHRIGGDDGHTHDHAGGQVDLEDARKDVTHGQRLGGQIADHAEQDRHRRQPAGGVGVVARVDSIRHGHHRPHHRQQAHALGEHVPGQREAHRRRESQHQGAEAELELDARPADEQEAGDGTGHGRQSDRPDADAAAGNKIVFRGLGAACGPEADDQHQAKVDACDGDDGGIHEPIPLRSP